jgi:hypothetical protein
VPLILDLAPSAEARQVLKFLAARQVMGRPFFAPPDLPADRAAALRKAFMDTMQDADSWPRRSVPSSKSRWCRA